MTDWNTQIIDEFRSNDGKVGGPFEGFPLLILHSTGAKSGLERVNPLAYRAVNGGYAVFGSKAGAPSHPDWFHNLVANPGASVEVGTKTLEVTARVLEGEERDAVWDAQSSEHSVFAGYQKKSGREIPVVLLTPGS